ncbi:MAG: bifunctional enoyl-CoA hydratase/phosphate acetyltransferase [Trueperaceae bacterium]|nr:bifunctional enoyl-CoA hydratase/phosphate acetyltransferase [Trueperaceae bacterium]
MTSTPSKPHDQPANEPTQPPEQQSDTGRDTGRGGHPLANINACTTMSDIHALARIAATRIEPRKLAVASAADTHVIEAVAKATRAGWVEPYLFGNSSAISTLCQEHDLPLKSVTIEHTQSRDEAAEAAVRAVSEGSCDVLMKGQIQTASLLRNVLNRDHGLRGDRKLSHVLVIDSPNFDRLFFMSDGALNIEPDLELKIDIVKNAIRIARLLGVREPKVALLAAVELVDPNQHTSIDHAIIAKMADRGQIRGAQIDGPLALDNAVDERAARLKNIKSEVAGRADVLIVDNIDVGNVFYKSLVYFAHAQVGGIIAGAKAPVILTSRADSAETKFHSLALGCVLAARESLIAEP